MDLPPSSHPISSHKVLARKYRPQSFTDLDAQPIMVQVLSHAIKTQRFPSALLLTGERGIGKTTTARIIARTLNCLTPLVKDNAILEACGVCHNCQAIANESQLDIVEIDAASYTSVDNVRPIIETANYKPVLLPYKIFIIDEAHMLTKQAFNSLLKTLEEPPDHLKFIFATTELYRVPDTVISRCMRFHLNIFTPHDLIKLLKKICDKENVHIEPAALALLAQSGQGSARDALSLLEQAIILNSQSISLAAVRDMLAMAQQDDIIKLVDLICNADAANVITLFHTLIQQSVNPVQLLKEIHYCVYLIILQQSGYRQQDDIFNPQHQALISTLAKTIQMPTLMRLWQSLSKGLHDIKYAYSLPQATLMILLRLCYLTAVPDPKDLLQSIVDIQPESTLSKPTISLSATFSPAISSLQEQVDSSALLRQDANLSSSVSKVDASVPFTNVSLPTLKPLPPPIHHSKPYSITDLIQLCLDHREPLLRCNLEQDLILKLINPEQHKIIFSLVHKEVQKVPINKLDIVTQLKNLLKTVTHCDWLIIIQDVNDNDSGENKLSFSQEKQQKHQALEQELKQHPDMQQILAIFPDATIKEIKEIK